MYKILIFSLFIISCAFSQDITKEFDKSFFDEAPNECYEKHIQCNNVCEDKASDNPFTICITDCSKLFEQCEENNKINNIKQNCKALYKKCSSKCGKVPQSLILDECSSTCEENLDKCLEKY